MRYCWNCGQAHYAATWFNGRAVCPTCLWFLHTGISLPSPRKERNDAGTD